MVHYGKSKTGSKVILFGEHFVVYGCPAIALPFSSCGVSVYIKDHQEDIINSTLFSGLLDDAPELFNGLKQLIISLKKNCAVEGFVSVTIDSNIPLQRGMGSSAAISIGIIRAFYDYAKKPLLDYELKSMAHMTEQFHHTNASGIDIETILSDGPIQFQKNSHSIKIESKLEATLLLVDSKIKGSTSVAVSHVQELFSSNDEFKNSVLDQYHSLFTNVKKVLMENNPVALGSLMNENHKLLQKIEVSHPQIDSWINEGLLIGALGGKITGGGLGGCFLLLSDNHEITEQLRHYYTQEGLEVSILEMKGY